MGNILLPCKKVKKTTDQLVHPNSLISGCFTCCHDSIIRLFPVSDISIPYSVSVVGMVKSQDRFSPERAHYEVQD